MRFNTKIHYGIRAMIEIALVSPDKGIYQKDIARNQEISNKYLDHIIAALKAKGLIRNIKGKKSGYILNRELSCITIYDIYNAFEPEICLMECLSEDFICKRRDKCVLHVFCQNLNDQLIEFFKTHSLKEFIDNIKNNTVNAQPDILTDSKIGINNSII
jgi:Rrf2 family protein